MGYYGRNKSGYVDPTANEALSRVCYEEKCKARHERRKAIRKRNRELRKQAERMRTDDK